MIKILKKGDLCPNCEEGILEPYIRYGKDTGLYICPLCWFKWTPEGRRVKKSEIVKTKRKPRWAHPRGY